MPKKSNKITKKPAAPVAKSTAVRNSPLPKVTAVPMVKKQITHEQICERAYFISISGNGGSQDENWIRAERELRGGI